MRLRAGLSQRQLADLTGIAQPNISVYESGRLTPSPVTLARIAQATAVRPSALLAQMRDDVMAIAARHRASNVGVFGSVATGSDTPSSVLSGALDEDFGLGHGEKCVLKTIVEQSTISHVD